MEANWGIWGIATKKQFDDAVDLIVEMDHYVCNRTSKKPLTLEKYLRWKDAIITFIENFAEFFPGPLPSSFQTNNMYRGMYLTLGVQQCFLAYLAFRVEDETGKLLRFYEADKAFIQEFIRNDPDLSSFVEMYRKHGDLSHYVSECYLIRNLCIRRDYDSPSTHIRIKVDIPDYKDPFKYYCLPSFSVKDGKLGYWNYSYKKPKDSICVTHSELINSYFYYYPKKRKEYNDFLQKWGEKKENEAKKRQQLSDAKKQLGTLDGQIKETDKTIENYKVEIENLQRKIFGKKKAQERITTIQQTIVEEENKKKAFKAEKEKLAGSMQEAVPEIEIDRQFLAELLDKFDNFIVWHWDDASSEKLG